jgi:Na+/proline symporter/signal transduction histidine kinase
MASTTAEPTAMFSPVAVILAAVTYVLLLFILAQLSERRAKRGKNWANNPLAYTLGLGVFCTTWTYYGSVGKASTEGLLFLTVYLGPSLGMLFGSSILRRLVRLKAAHRITSIADFVSARYAKSATVAALATLLLTVGIVPYVALQLKAVNGTFALITRGPTASSPFTPYISPLVVGLMILFTLAFGIRRLDPTERHPGLMVSIALESLVKLVVFAATGVFVIATIYHGPAGFMARLSTGLPRPLVFMGKISSTDLLTWCTYLLLSVSAFSFLPRQFHVGVVENSDENHVKTAMWLSPLYLFLMNIFVLPIALAGILTLPKEVSGDQYVLALPMAAGQRALSLLVFLGGFSAAIGMIMVEATAMATMISNHLLLPIIESSRKLWFLRRHLLMCRWLAAASFITASYLFDARIGKSYMLVNMGMLSFAAVLQLAPAILGGLFWRGANRAGAVLGLTCGFLMWFYTLLLPSFVRGGELSPALLASGPWGIGALRPEALLGLAGLPMLSHGVLWSMAFNAGGFVLGSVCFRAGNEERRLAREFMAGERPSVAHADARDRTIDATEKMREMEEVLGAYHSATEASTLARSCFERVSIAEHQAITLAELAELHNEVERTLGGAIGAAAAHGAMRKVRHVNDQESKALARMYAKLLANLNMSPSDLRRRIDFHQERESLLTAQAGELREKMEERDREIVERKRVEEALQRAHDGLEQRVLARTRELQRSNGQLEEQIREREKAQRALLEAHRALVDTAHRAGKAEIASNVLHNVGNVLNSVLVSSEVGLDMVERSRVVTLPKAVDLMEEHQADLGRFFSEDPRGPRLPPYLRALSQHLLSERETLLKELRSLHRNIEHIKTIVRLQQDHARAADWVESISASELVEDAIHINMTSLEQAAIRVVREYADLPRVGLQKHKILQILVNLIDNAAHALADARDATLLLRVFQVAEHRIGFEVIDNGIGIGPEAMGRLFQHGFTTKKGGHGFGLHGGALTAKEIGGALTVQSDGPGRGTTFRLEVPYQAGEQVAERRITA